MSEIILAIESSCDETAAAVIVDGKIRSNIVNTQAIHEKYGGVVPELASRAHQQNIIPVVAEAIEVAKVTKNEINAIAFSQGPGLLGALLIGAQFAKGFAYAQKIPLIGVHHMHAHILAHFIDDPAPEFPFLCLTVSGGHTQIVLVKDHLDMRIIGETKDDAVGEAFDKTAKMMGLPYPGGPILDKLAQQGNPKAYPLPIYEMPDFDFSFSGIKTAVLYFLRDQEKVEPGFVEKHKHDVAASIQYTLVQLLMKKLKKAARHYNINNIAIAGGVSANSGLRAAMLHEQRESGWNVFIPAFEYCTDNAAMIAMAAHYKYQKGIFLPMDASPNPRLPF
jgi:N6-L-threonylcarbamoyladenine synthase